MNSPQENYGKEVSELDYVILKMCVLRKNATLIRFCCGAWKYGMWRNFSFCWGFGLAMNCKKWGKNLKHFYNQKCRRMSNTNVKALTIAIIEFTVTLAKKKTKKKMWFMCRTHQIPNSFSKLCCEAVNINNTHKVYSILLKV